MPHEHIAYGVPDMDEDAGALLRKRLLALPGVHDVTLWPGQQQIEIDYDPDRVAPATLVDTMRQAGFLAKFIPRPERWPG